MNSIQYLGHSCFLISIGGSKVIIDPFIRANPLTKDLIDVDELSVDFILLTHGHGDHVADAEELSLRNGAPIIANFEVAAWFENKGCSTYGMNHGGVFDFGFGEVRMVAAVHGSNMPDGSYGGNPAGFLLTQGADVLYFAGDTALTKEMELIPEYFGTPGIAILPVGGFFTMDYKDSLHAAKMLKCDRIIGCHFNTFPPITIDKELALKHYSDQGKTLILPEINQIINL